MKNGRYYFPPEAFSPANYIEVITEGRCQYYYFNYPNKLGRLRLLSSQTEIELKIFIKKQGLKYKPTINQSYVT